MVCGREGVKGGVWEWCEGLCEGWCVEGKV